MTHHGTGTAQSVLRLLRAVRAGVVLLILSVCFACNYHESHPVDPPPVRYTNYMDQINEGLKLPYYVQSLQLHNVDSLPSSIGRFINLEFLELDGGKIHSLPPEFSSLRSLRFFIASNCGFDSIPKEVIELPELTEIEMGFALSALNFRLAPMKSLRYLNLNDNILLNTIPADIGSLDSLRYLELNGTTIKSLPNEIGNLTHLSLLTLRYTNISDTEQARIRKLLPNTTIRF